FTITAGYSADQVGGMLCDGSGGECSPTLRNLVFSGNSADVGPFSTGALGIFAFTGGTASPHIENVLFTGNEAEEAGAVFLQASGGATTAPVFIRTTFSANMGPVSALRFQAGVSSTSEPVVLNSSITDNVDTESVHPMYS